MPDGQVVHAGIRASGMRISKDTFLCVGIMPVIQHVIRYTKRPESTGSWQPIRTSPCWFMSNRSLRKLQVSCIIIGFGSFVLPPGCFWERGFWISVENTYLTAIFFFHQRSHVPMTVIPHFLSNALPLMLKGQILGHKAYRHTGDCMMNRQSYV